MTTLFTISVAPVALLARGLTTASVTAGGLAPIRILPFCFSEGRSRASSTLKLDHRGWTLLFRK